MKITQNLYVSMDWTKFWWLPWFAAKNNSCQLIWAALYVFTVYTFYEFQSFLKDYFVFLNNIPCPCPSILLTRHTIISLFCLCDLQRGDILSKVIFLFLCCTRAFMKYWWIYDLWTKRQTNLSNCREAGFFFIQTLTGKNDRT